MLDNLVTVYVDYLNALLPFALVFGFGNLIVSTILRAAFGGKLVLK